MGKTYLELGLHLSQVRLWMIACALGAGCGAGTQSPPPKHGITADDPTPSLPTYTPRPSTETREAATSAPPPASTGPIAELPPPPSTPPENEFGYDTPVAGCFEGQVYALPSGSSKLPLEYASLERLSAVYACEWNIEPHDWRQGFPNLPERTEWFAIHYNGSFTTRLPGTYTFRVRSDDGTRLYVDGTPVVNNDGIHQVRSNQGVVQLSPGSHQLTLDYFQGPRYAIALQVYVTAPGSSERLFSVRPENRL